MTYKVGDKVKIKGASPNANAMVSRVFDDGVEVLYYDLLKRIHFFTTPNELIEKEE